MPARVNDTVAVTPVIVARPWPSFEDTVGGLIAELVAAGHLPASLSDAATRAILDRERMASTELVEIGVSIPHARLEGVHGIVAVLAVSPLAVYYAHADAEVAISIMALVLSSPALAGQHLNFLSSLSLTLQSPTTRSKLRHAATAAQVAAQLQM
jgi:mannitol/fructose-specific phosphotransferase system IIA component (Ntr-type)